MSKWAPLRADVIMLSNTANGKIWAMTQNAIDTLRNSESESECLFNIVLVETNPNIDHRYENATVVFPGEEFNYNRFLNYGFRYLTDAEYVVIANNDLLFHEHWFKNIAKQMQYNKLDSASPLNPGWFQHDFVEQGRSVYRGYNVGREFCGWCLVFKRESLDKLLPLDEQFEFWCQDNDMALSCAKLGMEHALISSSKVKHITSQSHGLVDHGKLQHFTQGMADRFHKKWG